MTLVVLKKLVPLTVLLILAGCVSSQYQAIDRRSEPNFTSTARTQSVTARPSTATGSYRVQQGDTLYTIALKNDLNYRKLAAANDISPPYRIYVGQLIQLKEMSIESQNNNSETRVVTDGNAGNVATESVRSTPVRVRPSTPSNNATGQLSWGWPLIGEVTNHFASGSSHGKGIDIKGQAGDSVKAVADGVVVYSGNGLRAYGNLILIQHDDNYLSAYAFLNRSNVVEQQSIKAGEVIAEIGIKESAHILHLEIRRDGKPIDPESVLPKQ